ncbi:MAG: tRNA (adenosine(37)-N6)-threonylcarbamoyltransferase complex dimerization subunit type 1 TsaB, partial [Spirochaetes bacterium]|nr:tRNA (adenosine(37)-N6)-threonylcarbamoyltransferase complex dimerization subunit type 1 TsaB [Spirochaetota bacterium]
MANINFLTIDSTSSLLKIALHVDNKSRVCNIPDQFKHVETLIPSIEKLFEEEKLSPDQLSHIAVCCGPGSFTGIRIGVTTAISLAFSLNSKVFGFSVF